MEYEYWILCEVLSGGKFFYVQIPGYGNGSIKEVAKTANAFSRQIGAVRCKPLKVTFELKVEDAKRRKEE